MTRFLLPKELSACWDIDAKRNDKVKQEGILVRLWKLEEDFIEDLLYTCQWNLYPKKKRNCGLTQHFAFLGWILVVSDYIWNLDIFMCHNFSMIEGYVGNSLVVQRLGLCALTTEGLGLSPGWGTNTHKPWPKKREGKKKRPSFPKS